MGPVASISVRLRILATLRRWRPAIIRSTPALAQRLAKERAAASKGGCASWKSLWIPWPAAGRLNCVSGRTREVEQVSKAQKTPKSHDGNQTGPGRPCDVCCVVDLESHLVRQKRSGEAAGPSCPELAVAECEVMVLEARPPQQVDLATGA
jgi:hypothetical protein